MSLYTHLVPILLFLGAVTSLIVYVQGLRSEVELKTAENSLLQSSIATLNGVVEGQHADLKGLRALRTLDAETMATLYTENQKLAQAQLQRAQGRSQLERTNAQVKSFLDTPVPDDLRRMLNGQTANRRGAGKTSGGVPASGSAAGP